MAGLFSSRGATYSASTNLSVPTTFGIPITSYGFAAGGFLLEFPATPGSTYTIVYSDNLAFSNALAAQPSIVAPASRVQWIDNGQPKTDGAPATQGARFYRLVLMP